MLLVFLAAITARSIWHSNANPNVAKPSTTGPGGKPLPATDPTRNFIKRKVSDDVTPSQKRVFEWLSLAAALTFVGNSVNVIVHALCARKEHWWCGKPVVVSPIAALLQCCIDALHCSVLHSFELPLTRWPSRSTSSAPSSSTASSSSRSSTPSRAPRTPTS
jgi:hypothetical protein